MRKIREDRRQKLVDRTPEFIEVLEGFKQLHPWQGTRDEIEGKFRMLHEAAKEVFGVNTALVINWRGGFSGFSFYIRCEDQEAIYLEGKPSVITYLHELAHAMGYDELGAHIWSEALFALVWPKLFEKLTRDSHGMLVKKVLP
jgi:hypothetical protein